MNIYVTKAVSMYFPSNTHSTSTSSFQDSFIPVRRVISEFLGAVDLLPRDMDCIIDNGMEVFLYYGGAVRRATKWHGQAEIENERRRALQNAEKTKEAGNNNFENHDKSEDMSEKKNEQPVELPPLQSVVNVFIVRAYQSLLNTALGIVFPYLFVPPTNVNVSAYVSIPKEEKRAVIPDYSTILPIRQYHPRFINVLPSSSSERYLLSRLPLLNPTRQSLQFTSSHTHTQLAGKKELAPDMSDSFDQYLYSISLMGVE
jgi:hypothetical protein